MSLTNPDALITKQDLYNFYHSILPYLGGSAENIDDLLDVDISSLSNGQILKYNGTSQKWENDDASGGGGHVIENPSGTDLTQRNTMKFDAPLTATDDSTNSKTLIGVDTNVSLSGMTPPAVQPDGINSHYVLCSTTTNTTAKEGTSYDGSFVLNVGVKVFVLFTYKNSAANPTLSIDGSTAKPIKGFGTTLPSSWWSAGDVVTFVYDGTNWIMQPTQGQISAINNDLSDFGTYSTSEKVIGKWFGQTLYRKCFTATPTSGTQWLSDTIIANATIVKLYGIMNLTNGVTIPLPYVSNISIGENVDLSYSISNGVLFRTSNPAYVNQPITIVIEYVKTN